jgi:anthranilate synthase/aminodeoxychorismate synthase-like glutamine amidotransferase
MRKNNPSPFMGIINHPKWSILSGSPERLFQHQNNLLSTRPIAGTKKRGESLADDQELVEELHASKKENAEHAMLVDLLRNDLNKVCKPSSVSVNEDKTTEFYSHVMHLVSNIAGNSNANFKDILQATFPGGTITGAPKFSVMKNIAELEKYPRGPYTGSMGYISSGAGSDFNILIRSVVAAKNYAQIHAGAGIVIDSDPISEWKEINYKSQFIRNILSTKSPKINQRSPLLNFIKSTQHKNSPRLKAKVFFLENNDSFSFNIIAALKSLGAAVTTSSNLNGVDLNNFSHLIIGPGPHCATKLPHLRVIIEKALLFKIPLLGICLGHQAIAHYFGSDITRAKHAAHGEAHEVFHNESKIFRGVKSPNIFARYHSLQIRIAPKDFYVDAWTNDDIIMAISHKYKNIYGVQFHPESYLSKNGQLILENFLSI